MLIAAIGIYARLLGEPADAEIGLRWRWVRRGIRCCG
jgi:hypothetical protein